MNILLKQRLLDILNEQQHSVNTCSCFGCIEKMNILGQRKCDICGYRGLFVALPCTCAPLECQKRNEEEDFDFANMKLTLSCNHGETICPVCGDYGGYEEDAHELWSVIKRLREVIENESKQEDNTISVVVSEPGAAIHVEKIILSDDMKKTLTTTGSITPRE